MSDPMVEKAPESANGQLARAEASRAARYNTFEAWLERSHGRIVEIPGFIGMVFPGSNVEFSVSVATTEAAMAVMKVLRDASEGSPEKEGAERIEPIEIDMGKIAIIHGAPKHAGESPFFVVQQTLDLSRISRTAPTPSPAVRKEGRSFPWPELDPQEDE